MLDLKFPQPVKLFCGFIYRQEKTYQKVKQLFLKKFKNIDFESEKIDFNHTRYYCPEMGEPLYRRFTSFRLLKNPDQLVKIKLYCLKVEKKYALESRRTINIDPGYLNQSKLVLLTTKDFSHRVYLRKGIYAETTLFYHQNQFQDFFYTFPDYRSLTYKNLFREIRNLYLRQRKYL